MEAIIYGRFSSAAQGKEGRTSKLRQTNDTEAYAKANAYTVVKRVFDPGFSAWSNQHRERGDFGVLEREILNGEHIGRTLIVEHLDRLSRLNPHVTYMLVNSIVEAGVSIRTLNDGQHYEAGQTLEMLKILTLLISSEQNHKQSQDKSNRLREGYAIRRQKARESGHVMTKMAPPWLTLGKDRKWRVIKERASVVREIFRLADEEKMGKMNIARSLNERAVPHWPRQGRKSSGWYSSFVNRLITNPAVIGEFQPMRTDGKKRIADGDPIADYFPVIIDPAVFARVNAGSAERKEVRGRRSSEMRNLVSGIAYCTACKGAMVLRVTRRKGDIRKVNGVSYPLGADDSKLVCANYQRKRGCENGKPVPYTRLEKNLLGEVLHLALDDSTFANDDEVKRLRTALAEAQREFDQATQSAEAMWRAWAANESNMRMKLAEEAESKSTGLKTAVDGLKIELQRAQGKVSNAEHLSRVSAVRESVDSDDPAIRAKARVMVATAFRSIIDFIACDPEGVATLSVAGGVAGFQLQGRIFKKADAFDAVKAGFITPKSLGIEDRMLRDVMRRAG